MDHFPLQIYDVKHKLTLSGPLFLQLQTQEGVFQKKLVKRYVCFYNNFDVLQIYKTKKCPKTQIDVYFMPSATNAGLYGYQIPSGATWTFPATNTMVQLIINQNLRSYFGTTDTTFGNISQAQI